MTYQQQYIDKEFDNWSFFRENLSGFVSYDFNNVLEFEDVLTVHNNSFLRKKDLWSIDIEIIRGDNSFHFSATIYGLEKALDLAEKEYFRISEISKQFCN